MFEISRQKKNATKSSRTISCLNVELKSDVSDSASIIGPDGDKIYINTNT
jgi:hypothetical protein